MTTGIYRPVDDAVRIAVTELVHWIHSDYGLSDLDAYERLIAEHVDFAEQTIAHRAGRHHFL